MPHAAPAGLLARLRAFVARCILRLALALGLAAAGCAAAPDPAALTPAELAAVCANLAATDAELARLYGAAALVDEDAAIELAAFRGQVAEYRDRYGCN